MEGLDQAFVVAKLAGAFFLVTAITLAVYVVAKWSIR